MVLFNQPTHFKHSIFKTTRVFKAETDEPEAVGEDEDIVVPQVDKDDKGRKYLAGERLLKKINKQRKKEKLKHKKRGLGPDQIDRISKSLSRTVKQLTS